MSFLTIDFETYYDKDYDLKKLTLEEYIRDPRFEVIGVSVKVDNEEPIWFSGTHAETKTFLLSFDWASSSALAHHAMFDVAILVWIFGITPAFLFDTLSMARPIDGIDAGGSLKKLADRYNLGVKGDDAANNSGKHRLDFTPQDLAAYGEYCKNDTELCYKLFQKLYPQIVRTELELIHITILMFVRPIFTLDVPLLQSRLEDVKAEKQLMLMGLMNHLNCKDPEEVRKQLCSNQQFATILENLGVQLPMKISKTTGKEALAFAKTDIGFIALEESENPIVQQLCAVRLGTKSTLEESRLERFIDISLRNNHLLPIPLKYVATQSLRWAGMDAINMQNLPERDKRKKSLKRAIKAPKGYLVFNADSSQIEARICAWLSGQTSLVENFRNNVDNYCEFASDVFNRPITKADTKERFVGKESLLSLQFGIGKDLLQKNLKIKGGVELDIYQCGRIVQLYRYRMDKISGLWKIGDLLLNNLLSWPDDGSSFYFGQHELLPVAPYGIRLPNGFYIRYPGLKINAGYKTYDSRKGPTNVWGGVVTAHCVSALARIVIGEQVLKIAERYPIGCLVHDSIVSLVPDSQDKVDEMCEYVHTIMSTPPSWADGLPLACEIKVGENYGDCC
jgi:DNA polymerase